MANGGAKSFDNTTGFISYDSDYSVGNNFAQIVCTSGEARVTADPKALITFHLYSARQPGTEIKAQLTRRGYFNAEVHFQTINID